MLATLVEKVRGAMTGRREKILTGYARFVRDAADGKEIAPEKTAAAIEEAGKSVDDFQADVNRLTQRRNQARQIADLQAKLATIPAIQAEFEAAEAKLERAELEYAVTAEPLRARLQWLEQQQHTLTSLRESLRRSCTDPAIAARLTALRAEAASLAYRHAAAYQERNRLNESLSFRRDAVAKASAHNAGAFERFNLTSVQELLAETEQLHARASAEYDAITERGQAIAAEIAEIEERQLDPEVF